MKLMAFALALLLVTISAQDNAHTDDALDDQNPSSEPLRDLSDPPREPVRIPMLAVAPSNITQDFSDAVAKQLLDSGVNEIDHRFGKTSEELSNAIEMVNEKTQNLDNANEFIQEQTKAIAAVVADIPGNKAREAWLESYNYFVANLNDSEIFDKSQISDMRIAFSNLGNGLRKASDEDEKRVERASSGMSSSSLVIPGEIARHILFSIGSPVREPLAEPQRSRPIDDAVAKLDETAHSVLLQLILIADSQGWFEWDLDSLAKKMTVADDVDLEEVLQTLRDEGLVERDDRLGRIVVGLKPPTSETRLNSKLLSQRLVFGICILVFGLVIFGGQAWSIHKGTGGWDDVALKSTGLTLLITAGVFILVAGYSSDQVNPLFALLGSLAGYLLGKDAKPGKTTEERRDESPAKTQSEPDSSASTEESNQTADADESSGGPTPKGSEKADKE